MREIAVAHPLRVVFLLTFFFNSCATQVPVGRAWMMLGDYASLSSSSAFIEKV